MSTRSSRSSPPARAGVFDLLDVRALTDRQIEIDRDRTKRLPDLFARKLQRMSASPLAYLRGAAPLFYEMLANRKDLAEGPEGEGWLVGDLHLENFGAYRPDSFIDAPKTEKRPAVFDLNDFDDAIQGPWRFDVLRLMTSLLLAGRELGANGVVALGLCDHLLDAWCRASEGDPPTPAPPPVTALVEQVRSRSRIALLDARTEVAGGKRRFIRGPRYADLAKDILDDVPEAFERYIESVPQSEKPNKEKGSLAIVDAALRIAGTGSLGGLRIAVLTEGKGNPNGSWIFDLKEQGSPSAATILGEPTMDPASRVVTGFRACVAHPPRVMGTTRLAKIPMSGRRLSPQEDKLNLRRIDGKELPALASHLGSLLGAAHARGATKGKSAPRWSRSDREILLRHAITLAGVHEAIYLDLCSRVSHLVPTPAAV